MIQTIGRVLAVAFAASIATAVTAGSPRAEAPWVKKAKDLGYPAQNCLYCHTTKVPTKQTYTPAELNERGRWLRQERERRKAGQLDLSWLNDYPGGKDQK